MARTAVRSVTVPTGVAATACMGPASVTRGSTAASATWVSPTARLPVSQAVPLGLPARGPWGLPVPCGLWELSEAPGWDVRSTPGLRTQSRRPAGLWGVGGQAPAQGGGKLLQASGTEGSSRLPELPGGKGVS